MNLLRSVEGLEASRYFTGNSTHDGTTTHSIAVPANTAQLKVLLYWNDLPASVVSTKNLVNDLDLEVLDPSGAVVLPKILDTSITALGNAAVNGVDRVNNLEQVIINTPAAGNYTIRVKGSTVSNAQQEYFVVYDPLPVSLRCRLLRQPMHWYASPEAAPVKHRAATRLRSSACRPFRLHRCSAKITLLLTGVLYQVPLITR
jgi:hypothetical protein